MEFIDHHPVAISRALRPIELSSSASAPLSNKTLTQGFFLKLRVQKPFTDKKFYEEVIIRL